MESESKQGQQQGACFRRDGEYSKDQEQQYEDKETLFITNAQMSDLQIQYRLHNGNHWISHELDYFWHIMNVNSCKFNSDYDVRIQWRDGYLVHSIF